jgi:hypothetical protein
MRDHCVISERAVPQALPRVWPALQAEQTRVQRIAACNGRSMAQTREGP